MRSQGQKIRRVANWRKLRSAKQFHRRCSLERGQIQSSVLNKAGKICDNENYLVLIPPDEGEHAVVVGIQKFESPPPERLISLSHCNQTFHPPQHRVLIVLLRLDVECFVMRIGVDNDRQEKTVGAG